MQMRREGTSRISYATDHLPAPYMVAFLDLDAAWF
jgi:hypothetical protein